MSIVTKTIERVVTEAATIVKCDCGCECEARWRGRSWVRVYRIQDSILHFWNMEHAAKWFREEYRL